MNSRKLLVVSLAFVFAFSFAACFDSTAQISGEGAQPPSSESPEPSQPSAEPEESGAMEYAPPAAYIDPQSPKNIEERIILMSVDANFYLESWDEPMDINPDRLFEYYEAMVVSGEIETPVGLEYIPAETVYSVIQQHFDITESRLKESSYYDSEQDGFYVGGLGNVVDAVIEDIEIEEQNTVISYALYFQDELQSRGKLTVNIEDNGYKILSNEMLE